jgi:thymidylate kinase
MRFAICGPDRAGKTGLAKRLAEATGLEVVSARNAMLVKSHRFWNSRPGLANLYCMDGVINDSPDGCILDRGPLCTAAIHHFEWGVSELARTIANKYGVSTIFLDLPLDVARARREDEEADSRNLEVEFARYRELAANWPNTVTIDATLPPDEVFRRALQVLKA